ncbi:MAG: transketolase family protein [Oscillospiraceae bacterium]|nr:transketolase family protein [Oscillospiraceae bacterium]
MDVIKKATRESYGEALAALSNEYPDLLVLDADLAAATKTGIFKKACPERFIDCGIAEANMMGIAAGIAATGKKVFASSFAMFAAGRAFEIVRNSIGYPHLNVKIGATHAGISVGEDGATHQCNEDIALMRTIPGMTIINPADDTETKVAVKAALDFDGPVYMRFGRLAIPNFNDPATYKFELGKGVTLREGNDITIIATGLMVNEALMAADTLKAEGINARVINIHTIKPIDRDIIIKAAKETGLIVTAEEHSIIGGLGSAVSEVVTEECPVKVIKIGVNDVFGHSGPAAALLKEFGLSAENIAQKVREAVRSK